MTIKQIYESIKSFFKVKEFNHNIEDFGIKSQHTIGPFYNVMYTANGGKSWKNLLVARPPLFDYDYETLLEYNWYLDNEFFNPENEFLDSYRKRFKCYQDILDYHKLQNEEVIKGRKQRDKTLKYYKDLINNNLK
jgi:hypothetical protein